MNKQLIFLITLITLCFSLQSKSQNTSYADRIQYVFGNIDKAKVTTGYLKEFGVRFANIEACNGNLSTANFVTKSKKQNYEKATFTTNSFTYIKLL